MNEPKQGSQTALGVAWLRAAHQIVDTPPLILEDPVVLALFGAEALEKLRTAPMTAQLPGVRAIRSHVVLRSRYTEDRLERATKRGLKQYVVLGAGYDTFILRQPGWASDLRVFEVDHPGTQDAKKELIAKSGLSIPSNVTFVDVDFERESLDSGLRRRGVRFDEPTFFSWLGVTMYLTEPAIDAVLRTVLEFPPGSEITFTFARPAAEGREEALRAITERVAAMGEPWLTFYTPEALEKKLRDMGFADVDLLTPEDFAARYFVNRADGLPSPQRTTIISAIV